MTTAINAPRPLITLRSGMILHNGTHCRVVLRRGCISIGCSDITPEALRFLADEYAKNFPDNDTVVLQP
jgi:hypothetical protein